MRKWPAAKEWLVRLCRINNSPDESDPEWWFISYETLLELGQEAVERANEEVLGFSCGTNEIMCDALWANAFEFWTNWSIVTGLPLPERFEQKSRFVCAC
jgi:hypothetical protein